MKSKQKNPILVFRDYNLTAELGPIETNDQECLQMERKRSFKVRLVVSLPLKEF